MRVGGLRLLLAVVVVAGTTLASAQGRGGGGPGGGMGGGRGGMDGGPGRGGMDGGMPHGPFGGSPSYPDRPSRPGSSGESTTEGRLQLGPPGRWWDNGRFAQSIGLDTRQQRRMDDIFGENKGTLVKLYKNLQHEETQLLKTVRGKDLDEATIFQQIDRVAQARGELEKANAHLLLQIRKEMTTEQTARLDDRRVEP